VNTLFFIFFGDHNNSAMETISEDHFFWRPHYDTILETFGNILVRTFGQILRDPQTVLPSAYDAMFEFF